MDEEIEAQNGPVTCLWSHHQLMTEKVFKPGGNTASPVGEMVAVGGEEAS